MSIVGTCLSMGSDRQKSKSIFAVFGLFSFLGLCFIGLASAAVSLQQTPVTDRPVSFEDVRSIFERSCYSCHGPNLQMAELRLDSRQGAFAGGQSGEVIQPGNANESLLYKRVTGMDNLTRMPMAGDPLNQAEIDLIRSWIDQGALWPDDVGEDNSEIAPHWAYVKPERPPLPEIVNEGWPANPIDYFVLARLEKEGLSPSEQASRETLLRRLSLDLIGLPPSIEEIEAFLEDTSPDAYTKQVERLLDSPHYGEKWARHWLDLARYADSDGYEKDKPRRVWFYRDWVINALNQDMPYDRFIIDQLAGDLLPDSRQDRMVATGFLRNSMINEEGGTDPEQFRMEAMFDRMDVIGKILGVTVQCAQCHDHKYDPLTQEEYYRMFAFLNNCHEANIAVYTPQEQAKRDEIFRRIRDIEAELKHRHPDWRDRMTAWERSVKEDQTHWIVVEPDVEDISTGGQKYLPLEDGSFLAQGYAPTKHRVKMILKTDIQNITGFRLELLNHPNLPLSGPGRSIKGTGALTEFEVETAAAGTPEQMGKVRIARATADINLPEKPLDSIFHDKSDKQRVTGPIEYAIDGREETAWGIDAGPGRRNQPRKAVFAAKTPISHPDGSIVIFYLSQKHGGWNSDDNQNNNLGRLRLSITTDADPVADPLPSGVREILSVPRDQRTAEQVQTIFSYWRTTVPEWQQENARIEELWEQHPEGSSQLVLKAREKHRLTHVLERGDFLKPVKAVEAGVPGFLHALSENAGSDRLAFAKWLVDRDSPTTARALVNRVWQAYFGTGLVATSENLGMQAEKPSHPKLLDWLAVELMENGWSLKWLHRSIVTSATYGQSSKVTSSLLERDPENRLLARGPRFRVDAEIVRDIALAASGLLNRKIGGPSVYPPAPDFLFVPPASYGPKVWDKEGDEERYRRALYTFRYRSVPYPALQVFDAPSGESSCTRRDRSNTPLQALTTLNEPLFMECARALALEALREGGETDVERARYAFRRVLTRDPTREEVQELLDLLGKQTTRYSSEELDSWELITESPEEELALPARVAPEEAAAWTILARVLLNLDETITKE